MTACMYHRCDGSGWIDTSGDYPDPLRPGKTMYRKASAPCKCRRQHWIERQFNDALGARWAGNTFENYDRTKCPQAFDDVKAWCEGSFNGLYLYGGVGSGKTHLAIAAGRWLVKHGHTVYPAVAPTLLQRLRPNGNESREDVLKVMQAADYLILDDFGAERATDWTIEQLYNIINDRYNASRPVIITSNNNIGALACPRTRSRIAGMCVAVKVDAPDYRLLQGVEK